MLLKEHMTNNKMTKLCFIIIFLNIWEKKLIQNYTIKLFFLSSKATFVKMDRILQSSILIAEDSRWLNCAVYTGAGSFILSFMEFPANISALSHV